VTFESRRWSQIWHPFITLSYWVEWAALVQFRSIFALDFGYTKIAKLISIAHLAF